MYDIALVVIHFCRKAEHHVDRASSSENPLVDRLSFFEGNSNALASLGRS
jgi:hypothetical protein